MLSQAGTLAAEGGGASYPITKRGASVRVRLISVDFRLIFIFKCYVLLLPALLALSSDH